MVDKINIRIKADEKKRLSEVAALAGLSLSAFLRMAAAKEAFRVLGPPKLIRSGDVHTDR